MVTHSRETGPSSDNFNEQTQPDQDPQAVIERPPETRSTPQYTEQGTYVPDSLEGFNPNAQQTYIENPYAGQYRQDSFGHQPPVIGYNERLPRIVTEEEMKRRTRRVVAVAGAITATVVTTAAVLAGKFVNDAKEAAVGFEGLGSPPTATAPQVPGETDTSTLDSMTSPKFIAKYAEQHLDAKELADFKRIAGLSLSNERLLGATAPERQTQLAPYAQVIFHALGSEFVKEYNIGLEKQGFSPVDPKEALDLLHNGVKPTDDADKWLLHMNLVNAAATSSKVSHADAVWIQKAHSTDSEVNSFIIDHHSNPNNRGNTYAATCSTTDESSVFPATFGMFGVKFKPGPDIKIIQCKSPTGFATEPGKNSQIQEVFRATRVQDPVTGNIITVPATELEVNSSHISYFNLNLFPK